MRTLLFATLAAFSCLAAAQDAPKRKSGLWEMTVHSVGMPKPMVMQQCVDQKTDNLASQQDPRAKEQCTKTSVKRDGDRIVAESECKIEGSTARTRAVLSGDLAAAYKADITTTYAPPLHGQKEQKMNMQARWLGACKTGQKAGDMVMPGMPGQK